MPDVGYESYRGGETPLPGYRIERDRHCGLAEIDLAHLILEWANPP
jgi:hypothetical protein